MNQNGEVIESWLSAMVFVARHYRLDYSEENVRVAMQWEKTTPSTPHYKVWLASLALPFRSKSSL